MNRRNLIRLAAGLTFAHPLAALAQDAGKVYRLGLLSPGAPATDDSPFGKALLHGLAEHGFEPGKNVQIERRGAAGQLERLPRLVTELAAAKLDAIVTTGYPTALAAKNGTKTIPIVAINAGDPVATGLVPSLAHPGGNITGISDVSAEVTPKRLQLLKEIAPSLQKVAVLWNADDLGMTLRYQAAAAGAKALGMAIVALGVREPNDFGDAFTAMEQEKPDAILMVTDSLTVLNRKRVFDFAAAHRLPAIYEFGFLVRDGGLMSYGPDDAESFERVAALVGRIFKGANPAELPFEQPTKFDLFVNLKTAKELGLTVPQLLLAQADEVIE